MIVVKFFTLLAIFSFILFSINAQAPNLAGSKNSKIATTLYTAWNFAPVVEFMGSLAPSFQTNAQLPMKNCSLFAVVLTKINAVPCFNRMRL
uniref:Uncharacterized protein n=1 Tax=Acrobeloides nanus TaxID=290746 RepID=A0A914DRS1_9BILA